MSDYIFNISAKDGVSGTLNDIKDGFKDVAQQSSELEKIKQRFDKITASSAPAKKQLRDLQMLMANMNLKGLSNTDEFTMVAQKAGQLKDAMSDAQMAMNAYANDTFQLKAAAEGFQAVASAGTIATGVMGLFGTENEKVQQVLLKVQSAQAILNGVTALANVLNKDSALMLRLKQIRMAASTATTVKDTTATIANTAAERVANATTKTGTVIQTAWNTAKAIGKAMLGDFTGLVLLGIGAVAAYSIATSDSTDKIEEETEATKAQKEMKESYVSTLASTYAKLMTTYTQLRNEWNKLSSVTERTKWIEQHKNELTNLEIEATNVNSVEAAFNQNTDAIVDSFKRRAKAAAYATLLEKAYTKQIELEEKYDEEYAKHAVHYGEKSNFQARVWGRNMSKKNFTFQTGNYGTSNDGNHYTDDGGVTWKYTQKGAEEYNKTLYEHVAVMGQIHDAITENDVAIEKYGKKMEKLTETQKKWVRAETIHRNATTTTKRDPIAGSVGAMRNELNQLQNDLRDGFIPADKIEETKQRIQKLTTDIEAKEIELGLKEPKKQIVDKWANSLYNQTEKRLKEIEEQLQNDNTLTITAKTQLINEANNLQKQLDEMSDFDDLTIKATVEPKYIVKGSVEDKRQSIQNGMSKINQIADDYDMGLIDYKTATQRISDINKQIVELGAKPYMVEIESKFGKNLQSFMDGANSFNNVVGGIDNVVNSVDTLSKSLKEGADGWTIFVNAVNVAMSILNTVSTIMSIVDTIQTASNITTGVSSALKEKEAIAHTTNATAEGAETATITALATANGAAVLPTLALALATKRLAAAQIFLAHASIPFAGPPAAAAGVATMEATMAAITAFANGGIVKGKTNIGDSTLIRANNGEMVLNNRQQQHLFRALDDGRIASSGQVQVVGDFRLKGTDIYGSLKNLNKVMGGIGKNIGIR